MQWILLCISVVIILGTLLPINSSKYWFIRSQMSFRAYYLLLNLILLVVYVSLFSYSIVFQVVGLVHFFSIILCYRSIKPYLFYSKVAIKSASSLDTGSVLKILVYNVLMTNDNYESFIQLTRFKNPDIILLLEPNSAWQKATESLSNTYPYVLKEILENTYGIMLMSKLPFLEGQINHLVKSDIPSIEALLDIGGHHIRIYGLHPEPPIPGEALTSKPKDKELLTTAYKIKNQLNKEIDIVLGDLNDVGWSHVSCQFKKITGMKDPREGRGFYATFPTYLPFRIPIDHVFCSPQLKLVDFNTLDNIGSDHFPVMVTFLVPM